MVEQYVTDDAEFAELVLRGGDAMLSRDVKTGKVIRRDDWI